VLAGLKEAIVFFVAAEASIPIERAPGAGWIAGAAAGGTGFPIATPGWQHGQVGKFSRSGILGRTRGSANWKRSSVCSRSATLTTDVHNEPRIPRYVDTLVARVC
jgi:hypothetical protein